MDIIYFIIATIASMLIFRFLLNKLNNKLNLFGGIQKFANRPDRRNIYKNVGFFMIIAGNVYIKNSFNLNYFAFGITLGFLLCLYNITFENDKRL